jgi:hypothetical protein
MYYGILPPDENFQGGYEEINYLGYTVLAVKEETGYILERLYSTNPQDFLNKALLPGTLLSNSLITKIN